MKTRATTKLTWEEFAKLAAAELRTWKGGRVRLGTDQTIDRDPRYATVVDDSDGPGRGLVCGHVYETDDGTVASRAKL